MFGNLCLVLWAIVGTGVFLQSLDLSKTISEVEFMGIGLIVTNIIYNTITNADKRNISDLKRIFKFG